MADILWFDEVGSTNDIAKKMLKDNPESGTVVSAKNQTNGRGQYNRTWLFAEGSAAFSILLKYSKIPDNFTVRVGECVLDAIRYIYSDELINMKIKLPNDILIGGKKVCGILTEAQTMGDETWVVCGIGINANSKAMPDEVNEISTSLYLETGEKIECSRLIKAIQNRIVDIQ